MVHNPCILCLFVLTVLNVSTRTYPCRAYPCLAVPNRAYPYLSMYIRVKRAYVCSCAVPMRILCCVAPLTPACRAVSLTIKTRHDTDNGTAHNTYNTTRFDMPYRAVS